MRYIAKYRTKFFNALQSDARKFLAAYQDSPQAARRFTNDLITSPQITSTLTSLVREIGVKYARENYDSLRKEKGLGSSLEWMQAIMEYLGLNFYDKGVFKIVQTSREQFINALNKAVEGGWGYYDMARYIETELTVINRNRAEVIARTEVGRAIHSGSFVGADKSPFLKQKQWIAAKDNRTRGNPINDQTPQANAKRRPDHWHMDGMIVGFDELFTDPRSGVQLNHPHDSGEGGRLVPASEVIQCRCTYAITNKRDEQGRLVIKQQLTVFT
ncbi:MAG TPA: phage minor head protein [Chitinophagaceae bacterium]|nr:phage minor head protein [Chitinophagaceae bacterium]